MGIVDGVQYGEELIDDVIQDDLVGDHDVLGAAQVAAPGEGGAGGAFALVVVHVEAGAAGMAGQEAGEALADLAAVVAGALREFDEDGLVGGFVPEGDVFALGYDHAGGIRVTVAVFGLGEEVVGDAGGAKADGAGVEGVGEDVADDAGVPGATAAGGGGACVNQVVADLAQGFAAEEHIFHGQDVGGALRVLDGNGFFAGFFVGDVGFAVAVGEGDGVEAEGADALGHVFGIFATHVVDADAAGNFGDIAQDRFGVGEVGVVVCGGEGFGGLADGVELDAVVIEGHADHVDEVTEAVVFVEGEDVEFVVAGVFEELGEGGDGSSGGGEGDPHGAAFAWHQVGAGALDPALGAGALAGGGDLVRDAEFIVGGLFGGADGGPDCEADGGHEGSGVR